MVYLATVDVEDITVGESYAYRTSNKSPYVHVTVTGQPFLHSQQGGHYRIPVTPHPDNSPEVVEQFLADTQKYADGVPHRRMKCVWERVREYQHAAAVREQWELENENLDENLLEAAEIIFRITSGVWDDIRSPIPWGRLPHYYSDEPMCIYDVPQFLNILDAPELEHMLNRPDVIYATNMGYFEEDEESLFLPWAITEIFAKHLAEIHSDYIRHILTTQPIGNWLQDGVPVVKEWCGTVPAESLPLQVEVTETLEACLRAVQHTNPGLTNMVTATLARLKQEPPLV